MTTPLDSGANPRRPHRGQIALPAHLSPEFSDASLGTDLTHELEASLDGGSLRLKPSSLHRRPHELVVDHDIHPHAGLLSVKNSLAMCSHRTSRLRAGAFYPTSTQSDSSVTPEEPGAVGVTEQDEELRRAIRGMLNALSAGPAGRPCRN